MNSDLSRSVPDLLIRSHARIVLFFIEGFILLFVCLFFAFIYPQTATLETITPPASITLPYQEKWNYRQSFNACGPYSVAATLRLLTNKSISSEEITAETPWRFRGYTAPLGLTAVLKRHGINVNEQIVRLLDPEKILWLQGQLAKNAPVIILGRKNGLQHYVTIVGYEEGKFYVYDSLEEKSGQGLTIDKNEKEPGNATWKNEDLLSFWNQGGLWGLYKNYAIVSSNTL